MRRVRRSIWIGLLAAVALLVVWNGAVAVPVALEQRGRDDHVYVVAYRSWLVSPTDITLNAVRLGDDPAPLALFGRLAGAADALRGRSFRAVNLTRGMSHRLIVAGPALDHVSREPGQSIDAVVLAYALYYPNGEPVKVRRDRSDFLARLSDAADVVEVLDRGERIWRGAKYATVEDFARSQR